MVNTKPKTPPEERFWDKVNLNGPIVRAELGPCHVWTAATAGLGYGVIGITRTKMTYAHRLSLKMKLGRDLLPGMKALHHCDNPPCVRPSHLYEGTSKNNIADMYARGRSRTERPTIRGEKNTQARLTEAIAREIKESPESGTALATRHGVSVVTIRNIKTGRAWGWQGDNDE